MNLRGFHIISNITYNCMERRSVPREVLTIRMYGLESPPYILLRLITPRIFALEYVKYLVKVHEVHFLKYMKKQRMTLLIVMGGYAINDKKGSKEAIKILEKLVFSLELTMEV